MWNVKTNSPWSVMTLAGHSGEVRCLHLEGNRLVSGSTDLTIKVWDLESKNLVEDLRPEVPGTARAEPPQCTSLAWSADGQTLFAGYTDNLIRVWQVVQMAR